MVMEIYPGGPTFQASVGDIPEGMKLDDVGPKALAFALEGVGSNVKVLSNKEITLKDGTKAYRTDIGWKWQSSFAVTTLSVSAFKDGKWVLLTTHATRVPNELAPIVESLTFK